MRKKYDEMVQGHICTKVYITIDVTFSRIFNGNYTSNTVIETSNEMLME